MSTDTDTSSVEALAAEMNERGDGHVGRVTPCDPSLLWDGAAMLRSLAAERDTLARRVAELEAAAQAPRDVPSREVDEAALARLRERGVVAWADVPDASAWVAYARAYALADRASRPVEFAAWWRENFAAATPQDASFAEAERCARLVWMAASRPVGDGGAEFVHVGWADDLTQERPRFVSIATKNDSPAAAAEPYVIKLYAARTAGTDTAGGV